MNQRFEEYVQSATSGVVGLSVQEREQEATEIRQHLEELARKHEVSGYTTEQATSAAIQECGDPARVRAGLRKTYLKRLARIAREWLISVDSVSVGLIICLVVYGITSTLLWTLNGPLNQIFQDRLGSMFALLLLSVIEALCGGFAAGIIAPKRGFWGVLLLVLNLGYRCYVEFIGIATHSDKPGSFWLPAITTSAYLLAVPFALLWSVRYASQKRLAFTARGTTQ